MTFLDDMKLGGLKNMLGDRSRFHKGLFSFNFIYFWLCWVFVAALRLSLGVASGSYSSLQCTGFSLRWLLLLQGMVSRCVGFSSCSMRAQQLWRVGSRLLRLQQLWHAVSVVVARGLSSCGARAQLLHGMWDLSGPGIEPLSPALAGGFLTTIPAGKSLHKGLDRLE